MNNQKNWALKGTFFECCRVLDGHCGLWFGRDLPNACANLETYEITEGQIQKRRYERYHIDVSPGRHRPDIG